MAERAALLDVPEVLQTALPALLRSNDEFVRLVLRLFGQGVFAFSATAKSKTFHKEAGRQVSEPERTALDKEYNEEVLGRQSIRTSISFKRNYVADSGGVGRGGSLASVPCRSKGKYSSTAIAANSAKTRRAPNRAS